MQPNTKKHSSGLGGGLSFGKQIGLFAGVAAVIIAGLAITMSALGPKSSTPALISIAQRQQEIIRVSTEATKQVSTQNTSNFVANTNATMQSSQTAVIAYLADHGTKLKAKQLALDMNPKTDTLLDNAASANTYDTAVTQELTAEIESYQSLLKTTYDTTTSKSTKKLLEQNFTAAAALLEQAKSLPTSAAN